MVGRNLNQLNKRMNSLWQKRNLIVDNFIKEKNLKLVITDIRNIFYFPFNKQQNYNIQDIASRWQEFFDEHNDYNDFVYHLYLHIPFCKHRCTCCNYYSIEPRNIKQIFVFLKYLNKQIKFFKPVFKNISFKTLFLGGGSPSVLSADELNFLFKILNSSFNLKDTVKIFEANPSDLNKEKLKILKKFNIHKLSLGVQSLDSDVLNKLNRNYQKYKQICRVAELIKEYNFNKFNIDLLLGLKEQNANTFIKTLKLILQLYPNSITLYSLTPTQLYLNQYFNSNIDLFYKKYIELIKDLENNIEPVLKEFGYVMDSSLDKLLTAEVTLKKLNDQSFSGIGELYNDFSNKKEALLGLGPSARSYIYGKLNYKQKPEIRLKYDLLSDDYMGNKLELRDEMVKYIVKDVFDNQQIDLYKFKKIFNKDLEGVFKHEITALDKANKIFIRDDKLKFKYNNIEDLFKATIFFLDENQIINVMNNFRDN